MEKNKQVWHKILLIFFPVIVVSTDERSISVAWDYSCNHPGVFYKVYLEHLEWKACATGQKDNTRGPGTIINGRLILRYKLV